MSEQTRWHSIMTGLLYPAFLGNLIYMAFEKVIDTPPFFTTATGLLITALVFHYIFDFSYTVINKRTGVYGFLKFIGDLGIVVTLYLSIQSALQQHAPLRTAPEWFATPALWLFATKVFAVYWEFVEEHNFSQWNTIKKLEFFTDFGFGVVYLLLHFLVACNTPEIPVLGAIVDTLKAPEVLICVVVADALCYPILNHLRSIR